MDCKHVSPGEPGKVHLDALSKITIQDMMDDNSRSLMTEFSLVMRLMNGEKH